MDNKDREQDPAPASADRTMLQFRDEHKVAILLELFKNATEQMAEIKREEMSWLKVFLLLYGAIAAWSIQRWVAQAQIASSDFGLILAVGLFSFAATLFFCYHFLRANVNVLRNVTETANSFC